MISERLSRLLTAYVDGELSPRRRKSVSRLLRKSSEARKLYRKIKHDSLVLRRLPRRTLQHDLAGTIMDQITKLDLRLGPDIARRPLRPSRLPLWRSVAAAVLLCAIGTASYFYFAATEGGPILVEQNPGDQVEPRVLHTPPKAEGSEPDDSIGPRGHNPNSVFAFPNLKIPQFQMAQARVPHIVWLRDLDANHGEQLKAELKKDPVYRLDLFAADTAKGLASLQAAAKAQGIQAKIDPAAQARINRRLATTFAVYVENVTPDDVARLLNQLGSNDVKHGSSQFFQVVVMPAAPEELANVLGGTGKDFAPPSQRPVDQGTAGQIIHALPRDGTGKSLANKVPERTLVVVPYHPPQAAPFKEVKNLLDGYRESRPGTIQLLLVLWSVTQG